jgi:hypothetical protein
MRKITKLQSSLIKLVMELGQHESPLEAIDDALREYALKRLGPAEEWIGMLASCPAVDLDALRGKKAPPK